MLIRKYRRLLRWLAAGCLLLILLFLVDYFTYPLFARPAGPSRNAGANALWLSASWYRQPATLSQIASLAEKLKTYQIRYAYIHVGSVAPDGHLRERYPENALRIVHALHAANPGVRVIAWVYVGNSRGRGQVNLSNPATRATMAGEARWLTKTCGFDGIQWDYEICPDGDSSFLLLLQETRAALPAGKLLGVATPLWLPAPFRFWGWSDEYFREVAAQCDQVAVMGYDSGLWWPRAYVWLMEDQVAHVTTAASAGNPHCEVLIGVPTYVAGGLSHDPRTENPQLALIGIRDGLASPSARRSSFAGVAIFADYTTTPADWRTYSRLWPSLIPSQITPNKAGEHDRSGGDTSRRRRS